MSVKGRPDRLIAKKEPGVFQVKGIRGAAHHGSNHPVCILKMKKTA
jgi:hypothetical protein